MQNISLAIGVRGGGVGEAASTWLENLRANSVFRACASC